MVAEEEDPLLPRALGKRGLPSNAPCLSFFCMSCLYPGEVKKRGCEKTDYLIGYRQKRKLCPLIALNHFFVHYFKVQFARGT